MGLTLILPTLDEVDSLRTLLPALLTEVSQLVELIVVDDGSRDGTRELVREAARRDPRVQLVAREGAPSLPASLREGIARSTGSMIGWMDADGTMRPGDVDKLVDAVGAGATLAIGSRFVAGGRIKGQARDGLSGRLQALQRVSGTGDSPVGVLASWLLNAAVLPLLVGDGVHDYTSGFIVGEREAITSLDLRGEHGAYFVGLFVQARRAGMQVVEVPYAAEPRTSGRSKAVRRVADYLGHARSYLGAALSAR